MPTQVICHEGRNEIIAMVITALATEIDRDACLRTSSFQPFRAKMFCQELIGIADINQKYGKSGTVLDQGNRVMLAPRLLIAPEIAGQRLDTPRDLRGCDDR